MTAANEGSNERREVFVSQGPTLLKKHRLIDYSRHKVVLLKILLSL